MRKETNELLQIGPIGTSAWTKRLGGLTSMLIRIVTMEG